MKHRLIKFLLIIAALFVMFLWAITFAGLMASGHYKAGIAVGLLGLSMFVYALLWDN